jgi:aminoglycoside 6'-N-acetyltransferase
MDTVALRRAEARDWGLLRHWLRRPDIETWWGPAATTEAEVRLAMASQGALACIIMADGEDVGYGHAVDATLWGANLPDGLEPGTWDLDLLIASPQHRGRGIGATALALLKAEVFATTLAIAVCVFARVDDERAVRAYERAGFRWKQVWRDPVHGPSWFMVAERPDLTVTPVRD